MVRSPEAASSPGWTSLAPSPCPHRASAPVPHYGGPPPNSLQFINVCLVLGAPPAQEKKKKIAHTILLILYSLCL